MHDCVLSLDVLCNTRRPRAHHGRNGQCSDERSLRIGDVDGCARRAPRGRTGVDLGMEPRALTAAKTGSVATWSAPWQPHRRAAVRDRRLGDLPSTREDGAFGNVLNDFCRTVMNDCDVLTKDALFKNEGGKVLSVIDTTGLWSLISILLI